MTTVEAKLRAGLLAVFLLMYAVRATTSAELSYATYRGDEMGTTETVGASSRCGGYPYIGRKLIPCRSLKLTSTSAPPSPTKNHQTYQGQSAPPPLVD